MERERRGIHESQWQRLQVGPATQEARKRDGYRRPSPNGRVLRAVTAGMHRRKQILPLLPAVMAPAACFRTSDRHAEATWQKRAWRPSARARPDNNKNNGGHPVPSVIMYHITISCNDRRLGGIYYLL